MLRTRSGLAILALASFALVPVANAAVTTSLVAGSLQVTLSAVSDATTITSNGANLEVRDTSNVLILSTPAAGVDTLHVNGTGPVNGQMATLQGTLSFAGGVTVATLETLQHQGNYSVGGGAYQVFVSKNIVVSGSITSTTGNITLDAAQPVAHPLGTYTGVFVTGAIVTTTSGAIVIAGIGGVLGSPNEGVRIANSFVTSNGIGGGVGSITINGTGHGTGSGRGIALLGGTVSTVDAGISISGTGAGGAGTASFNVGTVVDALSVVSSIGAGIVAVTGIGQGDVGGDFNDGLLIGGAVRASDGSIQLSGQTGLGPTSLSVSVVGNILSLGAADITILGDNISIGPAATISAGNNVRMAPTHGFVLVDVGGVNSNVVLGLTNAGLARVNANSLLLGSSVHTGGIAISTPVTTPGSWNTLVLSNSGAFSGPGPVTAPGLELIDGSSSAHGWVFDGSTVTQDANTGIGFAGTTLTLTAGTGSDTFTITPSATTVHVDGNDPPPPALPGDTLAIVPGATSPSVSATLTANGYQGTFTFGNAAPVTFARIESGAFYSFVVSAPANATAGNAFAFTVTAVDQANNVVTGYGGTVHFTTSDGAAILPADSTLVAGVGTFSATLRTAGTHTITATDTVSPTITGVSGAIAVSAAVATHFAVSAPASATAATAFGVTVTALDPFNNIASGYAGTVHFTSTDGLAVLPANSTLASGAGTFSATLRTAGNHTITASDTITPAITGTSSTIAVGASVATHFAVSAPVSATAGSAFSFTVTALDSSNNVATGYVGTVHFASSDSAAVLPANSTLTTGVGTFSATLKTAGNQTLTGTDTVSAAITGTSGAIALSAAAANHFAVGAPASASTGSAFAFTATALDPFNNTAAGYSGTVHFSSSDAAAILPGNSTLVAGAGTFSATLNTGGNQTITATDTVIAAITGTSSAIGSAVKTFSGPSATGTGTITATFTGGGAGCSFSAAQFIGQPPGAPPIPPTAPPGNPAFPQGLFDFHLTGCTTPTITMTIAYPTPIAGAIYYKYGPEASNPAPHWYVMPATFTTNSVTFSITDGGQGDDDLVANGTIVDQGGPGVVGSATAIPALSWWMLVLLGLGVLGLGSQAHRKARALR